MSLKRKNPTKSASKGDSAESYVADSEPALEGVSVLYPSSERSNVEPLIRLELVYGQ